MNLWLYEGRHGERLLFPGTSEGFARARREQDEDNRMTLEAIIEEFGEDAVSGSEESGSFSIDDGGHIELLEVLE